jgi:hypothetical protein
MKSLKQFILETTTGILSPNFFLLENRVAFIKKNNPEIDTSHDTLAKHTNSDDIIDHFAERADPSKNKAHTQWIVGQYKKKNIRQEDAPRIKDTLSNFDKYKGKLETADINKYKHIGDVESAVEPHIGTSATKAEDQREIKNNGAEKRYEDDAITIHHIKNKEAAKLYGKGTKWCTAAEKDEDNMFDQYNDNHPSIHVIHEKNEKDSEGRQRKYQFHAHSNQFMDEKDNPISDKDFERIRPSFHKAIDAHPEIVGLDKE